MASNGPLLVEESTAVIVSGAGQSETRSAHFLLPRAAAGDLPALPSLRRNAGPVAEEELKLDLNGWPVFSKPWVRWVDKLRKKHEALWRDVGILDSVVASKFRFWREESVLIQAAAAFWSTENNTFVFPWGEATVTLEDVAMLGGLPLIGDPLYFELSEDLIRDVEELEAVRKAMNRSKNKKANTSGWAKLFLDREEEEEGGDDEHAAAMALLEHGAFLAMWLSIYVLPGPPTFTIHPVVFPLAARLARGMRVALAPAVLATIYRGLSAVKHRVDDDDVDLRQTPQMAVFAPLQILQVWFWERFPELQPGETSTLPAPSTTHGGASMAARWCNIRRWTPPLAPGYILAVFMSPDMFNWKITETSPQELLSSMATCLRPHELVGVGFTEQYNPHRVARQLGFDQDVPGSAGGGNTNASAFYDLQESTENVTSIFVPGVTAEYARWWEQYSLSCAADVANATRIKQLMVSGNPIIDQPHADDQDHEEMDDAVDEIEEATEVGEDDNILEEKISTLKNEILQLHSLIESAEEGDPGAI